MWKNIESKNFPFQFVGNLLEMLLSAPRKLSNLHSLCNRWQQLGRFWGAMKKYLFLCARVLFHYITTWIINKFVIKQHVSLLGALFLLLIGFVCFLCLFHRTPKCMDVNLCVRFVVWVVDFLENFENVSKDFAGILSAWEECWIKDDKEKQEGREMMKKSGVFITKLS